MKVCIKCGIEKDLDSFRSFRANQNIKPYRRNECRSCEKIDSDARRKCHKEASPKPISCELCGSFKKLVMDHDHKNVKFRGWICQQCNKGLGCFGDNIENLSRAIEYLHERTTLECKFK